MRDARPGPDLRGCEDGARDSDSFGLEDSANLSEGEEKG